MEKDQNQNVENKTSEEREDEKVLKSENNEATIDKPETKEVLEEKTPEEKILELEDKLARTFAEMENQRRRFEKEKEARASPGLAYNYLVAQLLGHIMFFLFLTE